MNVAASAVTAGYDNMAVIIQTIENCVRAIKVGKSLLEVVAASWNVLQQVLCPIEKKAVHVKSLRKDLLDLYHQLRDAYFQLRNGHLLSADDFFTGELSAAIDAIERACAKPAKDDLLEELQMVLDKACHVHQHLCELFPYYTIPSAPPMEPPHDSQKDDSWVLALSVKARMVAQALQMEPDAVCIPLHTDAVRLSALRQALGAPACFERACSSNYESAMESDIDEIEELSNVPDDEYESADEDSFWNEARCHFLYGKCKRPVGSVKRFGIPLARVCTPQQMDQALRELGEEPQWQKVREALWQHGSQAYCAVVDYRSSGIVSIQGSGGERLSRDLDRVVELLRSLEFQNAGACGKPLQDHCSRRIVVGKGGHVNLIQYSDSSGFYLDASHALDDLEDDED
eukprot:gnl/MRDRNA2_/MRDRNA2_38821_c0_seq1.p1 gnl/MRDRNA2_/MRDRNA2_38821_c0~~gnl/MRDRNA2_/MRDRNA2_38821_c0_seq1.p1  ORF type:complete len:401 (-),score=85.82 gnl/MRDRNA2_/MRDRNA2_38821_c0_seq1:124-1326(-)